MVEALVFLRRYGWILAVAALAWWMHHQSSTITAQRKEIADLRSDLDAEKLARQNDVAGLTALSSGLAKAAVDNRTDQEALAHAIPTATPASPGLADLMRRLHDADSAHTAARAGAAATR